MKRLTALILFVALVASCDRKTATKVERPEKPNILLIISDQLNWDFFSSMGNPYVKTPNIDRLMASGVRYDRAYVANPVCIPSRVSMFTGQRPTYFGFHVPKGIEHNTVAVKEYVAANPIAIQMQQAGYKTYYGGKDHFGWKENSFKPQDLGFEVYANGKEYRGVDCVPKAIETLKNHKTNYTDQPFFMVTSLMNPHDICYAHIKDNKFDMEKIEDRTDGGGWQDLLRESVLANLRIPEGEEGAGGFEPIDYYLRNSPPLPDNYMPQSNEPTIISGENGEDGMAASFGRYRGQYDSTDWKLHRFAYVKFVEEIDREVGQLLDGLKASGMDENTVIIFTSDHGEMNGAHQMAGKGLFFDEVCHVPFVVTHPSLAGGRVDDSNLVSNGLDLVPTLFGLAGVSSESQFEGKDLSALFFDADEKLDRTHIPVEVSTGMGLVSSDFYYGIYFNGSENNEQLYDMRKKPLQMENDALDAEYEESLNANREVFRKLNENTLKSFGFPEGYMKFLNQEN